MASCSPRAATVRASIAGTVEASSALPIKISPLAARRPTPAPPALEAHQRQHLAAAALILAKHAHHPAGPHPDPRRPHATRRHAGVGGVDHHRDTLRLEIVPD